MPEHVLTRDRKNAVYDKIQAVGLDVREFDWVRTLTAVTRVGLGGDSVYVPALVHTPTGYAFNFDLDLNKNGSLYSVYRPGPNGPTYKTHSGSWPQVLGEVEAWLRYVKAHYEASDLWAALSRERELVARTPHDGEDNSPFTEEERRLIAQQLTELRELVIATHDLHAAHLEALDARIQYLMGATERLGRFDWKQLLLSQLVSLVLTAVIPREAWETVSHFVVQGLRFLFGDGGTPELPGGPPVST